MENQHQKIKGYRDLNQEEIDLMNEIKAKGEELKALHDKAKTFIIANPRDASAEQLRWLAIGRTNYQQGLMAITRAVAAPNFE